MLTENYERGIIDLAEVLPRLKEQLDRSKIILEPDTDRTFAAYRVILHPCCEIWVNARTGEIFHAGRLTNRLNQRLGGRGEN